MELGVLFITAFLVGLSGALVPGPLTTMAVRAGAAQGARAGLWVSLGHGCLELALVGILARGLGPLLHTPLVLGPVAVGGAAILTWMGVGLIGEARRTDPAALAATGPRGVRPFYAGLTATLANPYWFLWWGTVGAGYVTLALPLGVAGLSAFVGGHVLADVAWLALVAGAVARGRQVLSPRFLKGLLVGLGVFLVALAALFGSFGVGNLWTALGPAAR